MPNKKTVATAFVLVLLFIVGAHFAGSAEGWYFTRWWFDMLLHFLGGFWLFTAFLHITGRLTPNFLSADKKREIFLGGMATVIAIGLAWEIFEYILGVAMTKDDYLFDTLTDILMDIAGGALAGLFFIRRRQIL